MYQQFLEMSKTQAEFGATLKGICNTLSALATTQEKLSEKLDLSNKELILTNKELNAKIDQVTAKVVEGETQSKTAIWIARLLLLAFSGLVLTAGRSYIAEFATKDLVHDTVVEINNKIDKLDIKVKELDNQK